MSELTPDDETLLRLQAELQKNPVPIDEQVSKRLGIQRLSATYVPDFLLHAPGKFSHQRVVIEVKSNPKTEFGDIRKDLLKIQRLITQYQYQQGVFLIVNTPIEQIRRKMTAPRTLQLVAHDLPDCSRILFISKERRDAKTYALPLDEIEKL